MRSALGGSIANTGRSSLEHPIPALGAAVVAAVQDALDAKAHERHRLLHGSLDRPRPLALHELGRVGPVGEGHDAQLQLAPSGETGRAQHRLLPGAVGVERQQDGRRHPRELRRPARPSGRCPSDRPRCESRPGAVRSRRCSPRTGSSAPRARPGRARDRRRRDATPCGRRCCRRCSGTSGADPRRSARAPNPSTRPRMSASGNMMRERKRSYGGRSAGSAERGPSHSSSASENPPRSEALSTRSHALGA